MRTSSTSIIWISAILEIQISLSTDRQYTDSSPDNCIPVKFCNTCCNHVTTTWSIQHWFGTPFHSIHYTVHYLSVYTFNELVIFRPDSCHAMCYSEFVALVTAMIIGVNKWHLWNFLWLLSVFHRSENSWPLLLLFTMTYCWSDAVLVVQLDLIGLVQLFSFLVILLLISIFSIT